MKILVFENQLSIIKPSFESVNEIYFDNKLEIDFFTKSQDLKPFHDIVNYEFVFVDISLSPSSNLDGIGILKKIIEENISINNIIILTGDKKIKERLSDHNIDNFLILFKPIDFENIYEILNNYSNK